MVIATKFVLEHFNPEERFYINIALDITPLCDCWGYTTGNILPDLGILGSKDIVAIDKANLDLTKNMSLIKENIPRNWDIIDDPRLYPFARLYGPWKDPYLQIYYAKKYNLGDTNYKLIEVKSPGERTIESLPKPKFPEPLNLFK